MKHKAYTRTTVDRCQNLIQFSNDHMKKSDQNVMQARKKIRKFEIVRNNSNTNRVNRHVNAVMPSLFEFRQ